MTVVVGCCIPFTLPDKPQTTKWMSHDEKQFMISRLQIETGSGMGRVTNDDPLRKHFVIAAFKEWKVWLAVICWWGNSVTVYG